MVDQATKDMRKRFVKIGAGFIVVIGVISIAIFWWFSSTNLVLVAVRGDSMEPTLHSGQNLILSQSEKIANGEIIVFPKPSNWGTAEEAQPELIKRVIAIPGDTLSYEDGKLLVNGELVFDLENESYNCGLQDGYTHKLGSSDFFAMGDNHTVSLDSLRILCDSETDPSFAFVSLDSAVAYGTIERII